MEMLMPTKCKYESNKHISIDIFSRDWRYKRNNIRMSNIPIMFGKTSIVFIFSLMKYLIKRDIK